MSRVSIDNLRLKLGGVSIPAMEGDNLSITLATHFENPDQENDGDTGWTPDAIAGSDATLDAIHALYAPELEAKADTIEALRSEATDLQNTIIRLTRELGAARDDEAAEIVAWLHEDAGKTADDVRKLNRSKSLGLSEAAQWAVLIETKSAIASAIAHHEHRKD